MDLQVQNGEETPGEQAPDTAEYGPPAVSSAPIYTFILLGCIAAVMLAQVAAGIEPSIYKAGFVKQAFIHDGEYWRILTGATMHAGLLHVGMNAYAFYSFGRLIELLSNRAHLAIVFLLSAVGGGLLSLIFMPEGISVGASGGIVGLIGYLSIYTFRRRSFISAEFRKSLLINIGFILVFGLVLYQVIDNFGHIGGLITGAVYGIIQIPGDEYVDPRIASPTARIAGYVSLGIYIAASLFTILLLVNSR